MNFTVFDDGSHPTPAPVACLFAQEERKEAPTLEEFKGRYMANYVKANREKAPSVDSKERILKTHLIPRFGDKKLDPVSDENIQGLKGALADRKPKTVNNVLTVLGNMLRVATQWQVIAALPCTIKLVKVNNMRVIFYEYEEYARLVQAAEAIDLRTLVVVRLGGDSGLRCGEIISLRWIDVDFTGKRLQIEQAVWKGTVDTPKGGRSFSPSTKCLSCTPRDHPLGRNARHSRPRRLAVGHRTA